MNKIFFGLVLVGSLVSACSGSTSGESAPGTGRLRIETACKQDADCPATFECEQETEHGATTSFCQSREAAQADGSGAQCPTGYEREEEHGTIFCKPHGGDGGEGGGKADDHGRDGVDDSSSHHGDDGGSAGAASKDDADDDKGTDPAGADDKGTDPAGADDKGTSAGAGGEAGESHGGGDDRGSGHG